MRLLVLGNNYVAWKAVEWLQQQGVEIVGLVLHPPGKRKYGDEIVESARVETCQVFDGSRLKDPTVVQAIAAINAEMALSVFFGYILKPEFLSLFPRGVLNLHPSYLPYNKGSYPNVWSIVEGTPAGVTLHYVDTGIDTGDIIAQKRIEVEPIDTGMSLYKKLEQACLELLKETWPSIVAGHASRTPQLENTGTYHRINDVHCIDEIDLDRLYKARDLINILRARTFPPYQGAYFRDGDRKVYMSLYLAYEGDQPIIEKSRHDKETRRDGDVGGV